MIARLSRFARLALLAAVGAIPLCAAGHSASTAYLRLSTSDEIQWRVALRDVDALIDLDLNADGKLTWGEVEDRRGDLAELMRSALVFSTSAGSCSIGEPGIEYLAIAGAGYVQFAARVDCNRNMVSSTLDYRLLEGIDPSHRMLVVSTDSSEAHALAPGARLKLGAGDARAESRFAAFVADGFGHILRGFDHLLFIVALMLPAVLARRPDGRWTARDDLRGALIAVAAIATAFTAAHSLTLAAATFDWIRIPGRVIEPLIAATVLLSALNNVWPLVTRRLWLVAFGFGLIHGFGFAEVLMPLQLPAGELAFALLGFNLGVELGQLAVVAAVFALLALIRHWSGYVRIVLHGGSAALVVVALAWIVERIGALPLQSG